MKSKNDPNSFSLTTEYWSLKKTATTSLIRESKQTENLEDVTTTLDLNPTLDIYLGDSWFIGTGVVENMSGYYVGSLNTKKDIQNLPNGDNKELALGIVSKSE